MSFLRALGDTGLTVSALGLGTVKIGRDQGVKYPTAFTIPDDDAVRHLLARARDLGINLIDTAPAYGRSEERLGQLLSHRDHWVIVTKVGEEFEHGESHFDFTPEHTRASVERSLRRLNTDHLDVVLVHSDGNDLDVLRQGTLEVLDDLKREGKIRATGVSTKTVQGGMETLRRADIAMVTYNLAQQDEKPVIDFAAEQGKGILIKKAFASGHLPADHPDPVQASLDQVLGTPGVGAVIAGTVNPAHLEENVAKARRACGER
ncbi:aldo/keto reductase [Alloalcanivorax gelatiniphagus]|uniref:Aldo/keto reductase n=1 Tax=Alloalcanivorax gelatiniphagus TaxID=1194167 RepID=A0ABY2XLX4_9GAMM|nr:aldo/keto reductase [Alloalcanivorax gelatiniphagus]TMW12303.1 aldo/keto reductase [Alloalcanivorax gelatiniphagus]|tara:strand:+ start:2413 stop:3198 length:786 start_codon:yes stop_codon:yes gene_type:complete